MIEFRITSIIFSTTKLNQSDPGLVYRMLVGEQVIKEWSATDPEWEDDFLMVDNYNTEQNNEKQLKQIKF